MILRSYLVAIDEPFATVFTEAMSAGKPLIWPTDSGHADVLTDGTNGLAVPPLSVPEAAAALDRLLADARFRQHAGQANKALLESTLTWDANAKAMVRLFLGSLTASRPAGTVSPSVQPGPPVGTRL